MCTLSLTRERVLSLCVCCLVLSSANAQLAPSSSNAGSSADDILEEVLVTATPLGDVLQPSDVIRDEELLLKAASTIGETLASQPGVSSSYFGPAASRPVIRGLGGSRVTMLSDSVSSLDVSDVSPDHAVAVETLLADQVEVIRGPTTLLYGSAAAGGVVNISDSRIPEKPAASAFSGAVELRADTAAEERTAVVRLDGGAGAFAWHVDAVERETSDIDIDGFATATPELRSDEEVADTLINSYSENSSVAGGASWVGESGYLGASISQIDQRYGLPGPEPEEEEEGDEPALFAGPLLDMEQTRIDIRGEYKPQAGLVETLRLAYGNNDYEHVEIEPSGEIATTFENDASQLRVEAVHAGILGWRGAVGVQLDDRDFSAVGEEAYLAPTSTQAVGFFIVEEHDQSWGHIHAGVRLEQLEHENDAFAGYDESAVSLAIGVGVDVFADSEFIIHASSTQRHPAAEELYSDGAHIATRLFEQGLLTQAGVSVETEDSLNFEIGLRRDAGESDLGLQYDVHLYTYDIDNYVYQALTGALEDGFPVANYVQGDAQFNGFEAVVSKALWRNDISQSSVRLVADAVNARLKAGGDLPRIPPWRVGVEYRYSRTAWLAGLDVMRYASQDSVSSFATDGYTLVNANVLWRLPRESANWDIFVRGSNLLDEDARKSTSFLAEFAPLPGRSLHVGVRSRF